MKFSSAKVWSFGTKPKETFSTKKSASPSPLDYQNINYRSTTPEWKISQASRETKIKSENPGPGNYNLKSSIGEGPYFKIKEDNSAFAHEKLLSNLPNTPAPGNYDPNYSVKFTNVAFSMRPKISTDRYNNVPGPGAYENVVKKSNAPQYSIAKSPLKDNFTKPTVSPGPKYNIENFPGKSSTRSYKFSGDDKNKPIRSITPGPGNYEAANYFGNEGKKISMGSKKSIKLNSDIPGPGSYQPKDISKPNAKSFRIMNPSRSTVDTNSKSFMPGPGQYTPEKNALSSHRNLPKWSMGNKTLNSSLYARLEKIHGTTPAPGNYDMNRSLGDGPKFSMRAKKEQNYDNRVPGPGHYRNTEEKIRDHSPAWRFGSSDRKDFMNSSTGALIPGPGNYSPEKLKASLNGFKFGQDEKNKPTKSDTPGPGQYHIPCSIVDVPRYMNTGGKFQEEFRYI